MSEAITSVADSRREVKLTENDVARFWAKVNKEGPIPEHVPEIGNCWVWTRAADRDGYGVMDARPIDLPKRQYRAHRLCWIITHGEEASALVLHNCDNPGCVRPDHLRNGTVLANNREAIHKGRNSKGDKNGMRLHPEAVLRGEKNANAKLNADKVREIRRRYAAGGIGQVALGAEFGVTHVLIGRIVRRQSWAHVE